MNAGPDPLQSNIFLHFLDRYHYYLARRVFRYPDRLVRSELRLAFRLAFLMSNRIHISGSAFFENQAVRRILKEHRELCEAGYVEILARDDSLAEHFERKKEVHYASEASPEDIRSAYRTLPSVPILYKSADIRTAKEIRRIWNEALEDGSVAAIAASGEPGYFAKDLEWAWSRVPDVLGDKAIVLPHVAHAFIELGIRPPSEMRLMQKLDSGYALSHVTPLASCVMQDLAFLQTPWVIDSSSPDISYRTVRHKLMQLNLLNPINEASPENLLKMKISPHWHPVARSMGAGKSHMDPDPSVGNLTDFADDLLAMLEARPASDLAYSTGKPKIGIVTALPEEWIAVVNLLEAQELPSIDNDPNRYAIASVHSRGGVREPIDVVITFLPRMGTNSAAVAAANLLRSFTQVSDIIFCGIACGCPSPGQPDRHVRLGDVVVSDLNGIVQLDNAAIKDLVIENRSRMPIPSRRLLNCVRLLEADQIQGFCHWNDYIESESGKLKQFRRPAGRSDVLLDDLGNEVRHPHDRSRKAKQPRIFHGVIGSSNFLIRNRMVRDTYAERFNLRAIEMEGSGAAEAVWQFAKDYLIVRGVCDYGDDRNKNDVWHNYAALTAAAYTKALLVRLADSEESRKHERS